MAILVPGSLNAAVDSPFENQALETVLQFEKNLDRAIKTKEK